MPSTIYTLAEQWSAAARYTAAANVDVMLSNSGGGTAHFEITNDDTLPPIPVMQGHPVQPGSSMPMQLKAGERLWLAGRTTATLGVLSQ